MNFLKCCRTTKCLNNEMWHSEWVEGDTNSWPNAITVLWIYGMTFLIYGWLFSIVTLEITVLVLAKHQALSLTDCYKMKLIFKDDNMFRTKATHGHWVNQFHHGKFLETEPLLLTISFALKPDLLGPCHGMAQFLYANHWKWNFLAWQVENMASKLLHFFCFKSLGLCCLALECINMRM